MNAIQMFLVFVVTVEVSDTFLIIKIQTKRVTVRMAGSMDQGRFDTPHLVMRTTFVAPGEHDSIHPESSLL